MIEILPDEMANLFLAKYGNKVIAAVLVIFFIDTSTYIHGASEYKY